MKVKELIEKLSKADQDLEVYLDDGFSVNLTEMESIYQDNTNCIVVVTSSVLSKNQPSEVKTL